MSFKDYEIKSAETLYDEWCISEEAMLLRTDILLALDKVNTEREQAFTAGFRIAMKQATEMMKSENEKAEQ